MNQNTLKSLVCYDNVSGLFKRVPDGRHVGSVNSIGYIVLPIGGKNYLAHRMAWLYEYGFLPDINIDHINQIKTDNRIKNLRLADKSINAKNSKIRADNISGITGVCSTSNGRWRVTIYKKCKSIHLGTYRNKLHAALARAYFESDCGYYSGCKNKTVDHISSLGYMI